MIPLAIAKPEAEPGAASVAALKAVEHQRQRRLGDARPIVGYLHYAPVAVGLGREHDFLGPGGMLERIADQIGDAR